MLLKITHTTDDLVQELHLSFLLSHLVNKPIDGCST